METKQITLFPNSHKENNVLNNGKTTKYFPNVNLSIGLNQKQLSSDFVLIHRILQKRSKTINKLTYILLNEMKIKNGQSDPVTLTRDTLINYYLL